MCIQKYAQRVLTVALLAISFNNAYSKNSSTYQSYEYVQIFQSIPALFEYLLGTVEENPEILEKNDVSIFKRTADVDNVEKKSEQDNNECEKEEVMCSSKEVNKFQKRSANNINSGTGGRNNYIEPQSTEKFEYGKKKFISPLKKDDFKVDLKRDTENDFGITLNKNKKIKRKIKKSNVDKELLHADIAFADTMNSEDDWNSEETYLGYPSQIRLHVQPKDIEQSILMTEKLLEDFNRERIKNNKGSM